MIHERFGENHIIFWVGTELRLQNISMNSFHFVHLEFSNSLHSIAIWKILRIWSSITSSSIIFLASFTYSFFQGMISFQFRDEVECAFGFYLGVLTPLCAECSDYFLVLLYPDLWIPKSHQNMNGQIPPDLFLLQIPPNVFLLLNQSGSGSVWLGSWTHPFLN